MQKDVTNTRTISSSHRNHRHRRRPQFRLLIHLRPTTRISPLHKLDPIQLVHDSNVLPFLYHANHPVSHSYHRIVIFFYYKQIIEFNTVSSFRIKIILSYRCTVYCRSCTIQLPCILVTIVIRTLSTILQEIRGQDLGIIGRGMEEVRLEMVGVTIDELMIIIKGNNRYLGNLYLREETIITIIMTKTDNNKIIIIFLEVKVSELVDKHKRQKSS